ncbi:tRNA pseudouridine(38-40) synthase TruA [Chloroflexota bacterium]
MARYKVILAYDGTEFFGSQRQADVRTVQSVLENALRKLDWGDQSITLAGRTDAGVHASGQVAAFDLNWNHPPDALLRALNALLPNDLAIRSITACSDKFHPRFDAVERSYRYEIICDPARSPLRERYAWRVWPAPDFELLQTVARSFIGTQDFAPFGGPTNPNGSTIREVKQASWQQQEKLLTFKVTANAFLYHMVRRMVFVLVSCGQGKLEAGNISQVLKASQKQEMFQGLAPPKGLSLIEVRYPSEILRE